MTLNSKHKTEKLKTKSKIYRNTKKQNSERLKFSFSKRLGRKCRLTSTALNKIMTTREKCIKYSFVAPLKKYNVEK